MGWRIFSHTQTPLKASSARLHQTEIQSNDAGLVEVAVEELQKQGHRITDVLRMPTHNKQNGNQAGRNRSSRRR